MPLPDDLLPAEGTDPWYSPFIAAWSALRGFVNGLEGDLSDVSDVAGSAIQPGDLPGAIADYLDANPPIAVSGDAQPDWGILRAAVATRNASPVPIVFAGSSTVAGSGASTLERRFAEVLTAALQAAYPLRSGSAQPPFTSLSEASTPLPAGIQGIGAGVSGTIASNFLTAQTRAEIGALRPRVVVIMVGANNYSGGTPPATYRAQLSDQLALLRSELDSPCLFVLCHQYRRGDVASPAYPWSDYRDELRALAGETSGAVFVDLSAEFDAAGVPSPDALNLLADTVHPSDAGHAMIADILLAAMRVPAGGGSVPSPPEPALIFDDFDRADGDLGTAPSGQEWRVLSSSSAVQIASGRAAVQSGNGTALLESTVADLDISADFEWNGGQVGVVFRVGSLADASTRLTVTLSADGVRYYGFVSGSAITQDLEPAWKPDAGTPYRLRVTAEGTAVTAYVDGVQRAVFTVGDEHIDTQANTVAGFRSSASGNYADSFEIIGLT